MQIVMLTWEYPPHLVGGLARHVQGLARALVATGHDVHVLTRSAPGESSEAVDEGVRVRRVLPYFQEPHDFHLWVCHLNFALMEAGADLLRRLSGPVVLHAHDWLAAHAAKGLKNLYHLPLVATIHATEHGRHGGIHDGRQQYINDIEWWLTYEAWRVIVCSRCMRAEVQGLFRLPEDKVTVIPNGIDLPAADAPEDVPPREAYADPGERLLFHLGRLVPEKGAAVLLETLPLLLRRHPVRLVIGGVGPYREELERRARELGVAHRVRFTGWLGDREVQALYRYADAAVVPSTYEPFGIVALEAMASGVPLVATRVGGLAEIVRHGENGLVANPGDPVSLAEQIDRLLTDRKLAKGLASEARRAVMQRYSWEGVATQTATVYQEVAEACARTPWGSLRPEQTTPPVSGDLPGRYTI